MHYYLILKISTMKKYAFLSCFIAFCFLIGITKAWAYDFSAMAPSGQTLYYNIVNGEAQVTNEIGEEPYYTVSPTGALIIPSVVNHNNTNYSVTSIGENAFNLCYELTSVEIPNSVTTIDDYAFWSCMGVSSVTIGNAVNYIGGHAFFGCYNLTSMNYTGTLADWCRITFVDDQSNPLSYCFHLIINDVEVTSLVIPDSITEIKPFTFHGCRGLISVTINDNVTTIGKMAFANCINISSLNFGNSLITIGQSAFSVCPGLTSVIIPNSVITIGDSAFIICTGLTSVAIGNSVETIGPGAFYGCEGLTAITIPNSVVTIGQRAFFECHNLASVNMGDSVEIIDDEAFGECWNLTGMVTPNPITFIGWRAFYNCKKMESVTIGSSITTIEDEAFYKCQMLSDVIIRAVYPPACEMYVFMGIPYNSKLTVPCGASSYYRETWPWYYYFPNIVEDCVAVVENDDINSVEVFVRDGQIVVRGATEEVFVLDITGRMIASAQGDEVIIDIPQTGLYLIESGNNFCRKVVVMK